jgi:hypothetical protein
MERPVLGRKLRNTRLINLVSSSGRRKKGRRRRRTGAWSLLIKSFLF